MQFNEPQVDETNVQMEEVKVDELQERKEIGLDGVSGLCECRKQLAQYQIVKYLRNGQGLR